MVSIGETDDEFKKSLLKVGKLKEVEADEGMFAMAENHKGRTLHLDGGQTIIRIPTQIKTAEQHGTLAHEIFHAVEFLFRRLNTNLTLDSDEPYAYLIGYLTEQIYSRFKI